MRRVVIIAGIILAVATVVYLLRVTAINRAREEKAARIKALEAETVIPVRVAPVTTGSVEKVLRYTGTVEAADRVQVNSKVAGRIVALRVKEGDAVAKGQVVAVVDPEVTGQKFEPFEVTAPIAGRVSEVFLDRGSYTNQAVPIVEIINDASVKVRVGLLEKDYAAARKGTPVRLEFDAFPGRVRTAEVTNRSAVVDRATGTIGAEIDLANSDASLRPGMFVRVQLVPETHTGVALVPAEATTSEVLAGIDEAVEAVVFVLEGDHVRERHVRLGLTNGTHYEVLEGLAAGDQVITLGQNLLRDGVKVNVLEQ
jgi:multidrug efflux pump subunit AcrA (membrane-fusion protein)